MTVEWISRHCRLSWAIMTWRHRSTSSFRPDRSVLSATLKPWTSSNRHYALERRRTSDRQSSPRQHGKQSHHQHHHLSHFHLHLLFYTVILVIIFVCIFTFVSSIIFISSSFMSSSSLLSYCFHWHHNFCHHYYPHQAHDHHYRRCDISFVIIIILTIPECNI